MAVLLLGAGACNGKDDASHGINDGGSGGTSAGPAGSGGAPGGRGGSGGSAGGGGTGGSVRTGGTGGSVSTGGTGGSSSTGGAGGARPVDAATGSGGAGGGAVDANRADSAPAGGRPDTGSVAAMCPGGGAFPTLRQTAVTNVSAPIHLVGHPAEPGVLYILERGGNVRIMRDGVLQPQPFFTVSPVETGSERGALSLALHPAFNENGRIFVFFTQPDSTIEEWKRMTPTSATKVKEHYRYAHSAGNHQGGNLAFGSDGMLYFSLGDNASGGNASNPASRYGKIMRINPDTSMPADGNLNGYTWAYGLRNPWRISFDRMTGDLYIADVGQNTQEEINFEPKGMGGRNYGWPGAEGNLGSGGVRPVHVYDRSVGKSITGGYVYRGKKYPCLSGHYFYGDYDSTSVRSFMVKDGMATDHRTHAGLSGNAGGGIYSFGEDGNGELYILRGGGRVTRIDAE